MTGFASIGRSLPRREDRRLLLGKGRFIDDIRIPGALHAAFVRSPHAHARIKSIDTSAARRAPGVVAIVTADDLAQWTAPLRMAPPIEGLHPMEMTTLPRDKVRFAGDPVACVVASDRYLAEDAAELVAVDYLPLQAVASIEAALAKGAPKVDDALPGNLVSQQRYELGDPKARFAAAGRIVEARFVQHRQTHAPIEARGCIGIWDDGREHLTMYAGNQAPHPYRTALANRLKLRESQVTVISPEIGGGFGQKIALFREELTVAALARALLRPVRWSEDRLENFLASLHAREDTVSTRAAVSDSGRIVALEMAITADFGAYSLFPANYMARVVGMILTGPYKIQDYAYEVRAVLTNKCPAGPMRAPMAITSWVMDGTIDAIARALAKDPLEIRRLNMVANSDLPYVMATGERLADVSPRETMELALEKIGYARARREQAELRTSGRIRGIGLCNVVESTTYGSRFYKSAGILGSGHEAAWIKIEPSGAVNASCGLMASGQGSETAFAQMVAEGLGISPEAVAIQLGDTSVAPYGMGARGSRGATAGGGVLYLAAQKLRAKVEAIAAAMLGLNTADEVRLRQGRIERRLEGSWADAGIGLAEIARTAYLDPLRLPAGMEPGLEAHLAYDPPPMTYSNATHIAEVEIDPQTGEIKILRYLIAEDAGTVINPMLADGQNHGATAMGIGGVLFEEIIYDAAGQNLTGSFAEYLLPTAGDLPEIEIVHHNTPNRSTPAGVKGMAEGGVMGAIGAVCNAVADALVPFAITVDRQPLSPERIRALLRGKLPAAT
jgi:aerobic carbon-monoxide dehydrogenase large subunit